MPKPVVHSHTYQHFDDLQLSSNDFYTNLKDLIESYQFPSVRCTKVAISCRRLFSTERIYLCVSMGLYQFYICAAPFGRSFFISWWLEETEDGFTKFLRRIPIIRWFVDSPDDKSYFEIDTELMFTNSIDYLVRIAVEKIANERGFREVGVPIVH